MEDPRSFAGFTVWGVRILSLAIAIALLWWSTRLEREFQTGRAATFAFDWGRFWVIQAVYVMAGVAFGVAVRFPFTRPRFAWGRLLIAGIVFLPVVQVWYMFGVVNGLQLLRRAHWWLDVPLAVWPILAGVAIGAGFGARQQVPDQSTA